MVSRDSGSGEVGWQRSGDDVRGGGAAPDPDPNPNFEFRCILPNLSLNNKPDFTPYPLYLSPQDPT